MSGRVLMFPARGRLATIEARSPELGLCAKSARSLLNSASSARLSLAAMYALQAALARDVMDDLALTLLTAQGASPFPEAERVWQDRAYDLPARLIKTAAQDFAALSAIYALAAIWEAF